MSKKFKQVLFICTVNHYRSRFSEYLFNSLAKKSGLRWRATSRGFKPWIAEGHGPISHYTADRLAAMGVPFESERSPIKLSVADLEAADLVVAVKKGEHYAMMLDEFPHWAHRIEYWHVDDQDCATPDEALLDCEACVRSLVRRLLMQQEQEPAQQLRRAG